ncbi:MAG: NAD-dependent deacylase [Myxococcota bacterium]
MNPSNEDMQRVADALATASQIVVLTGAGVSKESGIPTFRDSLEGMWSTHDPRELATPEAFANNPALVTEWYDSRRLAVLEHAPNPGHYALGRMEQAARMRGAEFTVLTQNVDGFHHMAGSVHVVEVHGSITRWRCTQTGAHVTDLPDEPFETYPPPSKHGGLLRPDVVWFGEALPPEALAVAEDVLARVDLYLAIGTSGVVWPSAGFVLHAQRQNALCVEINPNPTDASAEFSVHLRGPSGVILPALEELM